MERVPGLGGRGCDGGGIRVVRVEVGAMSEVELLRRAAKLMRERAGAATAGPWVAWSGAIGGGGEYVSSTADGYTFGISPGLSNERGFQIAQHDGEHIASWHPVVALAVADWLDWMLARVCSLQGDHDPEWTAAVKVARAYLGQDVEHAQEGQRRASEDLEGSE